MARKIGELLEPEGELVGRGDELAALSRLFDAHGPLVAFVHGIGGIGKSAMVTAFSARARAQGAVVVRLEGGAIEPTERGITAAIADAIGAGGRGNPDALGRLSSLADRVLLVIDAYELLRPLDPWLRDVLVPSFGEHVRVLLAGREPPLTNWRDGFGARLMVVPLVNLGEGEALALLRGRGIGEAQARRINRLARGHPLSLRLAAAAWAEPSELSREASSVRAMVEGLTELYLAALDPMTRRVLEAASVVRRPTVPLLAAMEPEASPQDAFDRLRSLPFVRLSVDGLAIHDTVREVVAASLRSSDPERSRAYRIAAWRQLRRELDRAGGHEMWRYTADLLYLLENPMIREAFFPTTEHRYFVEAARPEDRPAIESIVIRQVDIPVPLAALEEWLDRMPDKVRVARDEAGAVVGCMIVAELRDLPHALVEADRAAWRCWDHLRRHPVPPGSRVLIDRFELADAATASAAAVAAALVLDLKRMYMELRPQLRRIYTVELKPIADGSAWAQLGFETIRGGPTEVENVRYHPAVLDFGPRSVDGWLARVVKSELQVEEDEFLDADRRRVHVDGRAIDLTRLEFELLSRLARERGIAVSRKSLLRDVWGHEDPGGGNLIEAAVRSLRRKLGEDAGLIETVRGVGYRLRSDR